MRERICPKSPNVRLRSRPDIDSSGHISVYCRPSPSSPPSLPLAVVVIVFPWSIFEFLASLYEAYFPPPAHPIHSFHPPDPSPTSPHLFILLHPSSSTSPFMNLPGHLPTFYSSLSFIFPPPVHPPHSLVQLIRIVASTASSLYFRIISESSSFYNVYISSSTILFPSLLYYPLSSSSSSSSIRFFLICL